MPAIEIQGLTKSFGAKQVLAGIDLAVEPGEVFGYIGPNGAGKTTTVRILCGMDAGFQGRVRVAGIDVREDPLAVKRIVGYLPESAQLYESLTVLEHLLLVGRLHGLPDDLIVERAFRILRAFDLGGRRESRLGSLSKGMRQKVMITAALLHDPRVLFFDEPLSGLDVNSTVLIKELLRSLAERGRCVLYCSHMMDVVERVCDRIAILDGGRVVARGSFDELVAASRSAGTTLETIFLELTQAGDARERSQEIVAAFADDGAGRHETAATESQR